MRLFIFEMCDRETLEYTKTEDRTVLTNSRGSKQGILHKQSKNVDFFKRR
jgi:hypothetical protein